MSWSESEFMMCNCVVLCVCCVFLFLYFFFFQAEDGIRDLVRSRGLGDVYKRQQAFGKLFCGQAVGVGTENDELFSAPAGQ